MPKKGEKRTVTLAEAMHRRGIVERLMLSGLTRDQTIREARRQGIKTAAAERYYGEVEERWRGDAAAAIADRRAAAIQRVSRDLAELRNPGVLRDRDGNVVEEEYTDERGRKQRRPVAAVVDFARVNQHERLLAQLEGTMQPVELRVDVNATVQRALVAVVQGYTPERLDALVAEQLELEEAASGTTSLVRASGAGRIGSNGHG